MTMPRLACLAMLAVGSAAPVAAQSSGPFAGAEAAVRVAQRIVAQYALLAARSAVDLTYDAISVDPRTNDLAIAGLELRPRLAWDPQRQCRISIDRVTVPAGGPSAIDRLSVTAEIDGVDIPSACFQPAIGMTAQSFGYESIRIESAALDLSYHLPSSGADLLVTAAVADAAEVQVAAQFDYIWLTGLARTGGSDAAPEPVAHLSELEVVLENDGLWERLEPMVSSQFGDPQALPEMMRAMLGQMLAENGGQPGPEARKVIDNAAEQIGRFVRDGDRLVLTAAPEGGVWLDSSIFQTPGQAIAALQPRFSSAPLATGAVIDPALLSRALSGGENLDDAERLRVGRALLTGVGAPLAAAEGFSLVEPLAAEWNAEAAALVAEANAAKGNIEAAYAAALRAQAGKVGGVAALVPRLEGQLSPGTLLMVQERILSEWSGRDDWRAARDAAEAEGDIAMLRRMASDVTAGRGMPRSYVQGYYLASLTAAAGDRIGLRLRERIDARFEDAAGTGWEEARSAAAAAALETWTSGGLAGRVVEMAGGPE